MSTNRTTVPLSHALGMGQRDSSVTGRDSVWDTRGTVDLKALARKALGRDTSRDTSRDGAQSGVPNSVREIEARGTPSEPRRAGGKMPAARQESQTAGNAPRTSDDASRAPEGPRTRSDARVDSGESAADRFEERAALIEYGAGVPREWAEGFARLDLASPPAGFDAKRWRTLIDDGGKFLDRWGGEAARLGWSALDLLGAHPVAPAFRYDAAADEIHQAGGVVSESRSNRVSPE